jgi:hypothetical protein
VQFYAGGQLRDQQTHATATASGVVVGEICRPPNAGRFCSASGIGQLNATIANELLTGELRVTVGQSTEVWTLDLGAWTQYYLFPSNIRSVAGQYADLLSDFTSGTHTVINVDSAGRMFFQSATSQCVGNGQVTQHGDGRFGVLVVALQVASCAGEFGYLDGDYQGLLILTPGGYWDYDSVMRMWLSRTAAPQVGVSIVAPYIY